MAFRPAVSRVQCGGFQWSSAARTILHLKEMGEQRIREIASNEQGNREQQKVVDKTQSG